jgi:hypothetical protein
VVGDEEGWVMGVVEVEAGIGMGRAWVGWVKEVTGKELVGWGLGE